MNTTHRWPTHDQYTYAYHCECGAQPGQECNAPRKTAERDRYRAAWTGPGKSPGDVPVFHTWRQDKGTAHYYRDVGNAPWVEDREPGRCYCTLDPCPLATTP